MIFFPKEAAKLLGISVRKLKEMADDNLIPHYKTRKGYIRFTSENIEEACPGLLGTNFKVTSTYIRPQRLITSSYVRDKGKLMETYTRNSKEALNLGSGLPWDIKGVLSVLVDLMAIHDNNGIPCDPPMYICGLVGCGMRKWTQTIEPALLSARKIKRVKRGGIEVYVWHDHNLMVGPRALVQEVEEYIPPSHYPPSVGGIDSSPSPYWENNDPTDPPPAPGLARVPRVDAAPDIHHNPLLQDLVDRGMVKDESTAPENEPSGGQAYVMDPHVKPGDAISVKSVAGVTVTEKEPEEVITEALDIVAELQESHPDLMSYEIEIDAGGKTVEEFEESVMKELIPMPTAYDVLGRAGIDVENHPRGEFFWSRVEHTDVLKEWLETVPLSEIVVRIDKARIAGRLSDHMNRMEDFTEIVMGIA